MGAAKASIAVKFKNADGNGDSGKMWGTRNLVVRAIAERGRYESFSFSFINILFIRYILVDGNYNRNINLIKVLTLYTNFTYYCVQRV
jgi:hypothetical protein